MGAVGIEYRINFGAKGSEVFDIQLDDKTFDLIAPEVPDPPAWTELSYRQCSHCPLSQEEHSHCPLALQMHGVVERFHGTRSIDQVGIEVVTEERRVIQSLDLQSAIASMLDLIVPVCGCPKTAFMKPLARFHLPLASEEETVFRVVGMYLLSQYFVNLTSKKGCIEFDDLTKIYEDLHILNTAVVSRLQHVTRSDSVKNAITLADMYSLLVPALLEDQLVEMRGFFEAYLPKDAIAGPVTSRNLEQAKAFRSELAPLELVPLDSERKKAERPAWLKEIVGEQAQDAEEEAPAEEAPDPSERVAETIEKILGGSGMTLELEPLEDEETKDSESREGADGSKSTRAVFKLPDE